MVRIVTPPATEPVSLSDFKAWMRGIPIPPAQEGMINTLLKAGREEAERYQNVAYMEQTLQIALDVATSGAIVLPRPPFKELQSVVCYDAEGKSADVTADFDVNNITFPSELQMKSTGSLPYRNLRHYNALVITYKAGADKVPERVKQAILLYAAWAYMHPSGDEPIPKAFYALLQKGRVPL